MQLSDEQLRVVNATEPHILVRAAAGSGKTTTLTARVHHLLEIGILPQDIVAITYTRLAAEEMMTRLNAPAGLTICTVHALANRMLNAIGVDTSYYRDEEKFDELFWEVKRHPECAKTVKYLIVDESQDLAWDQWDFIWKYLTPENYMIFYDLRQLIYEWTGKVSMDDILELESRPDVKIYELNRNYRCAQQVLIYAKSKLQYLTPYYPSLKDNSVAVSKELGFVQQAYYTKERLLDIIYEDGHYEDWFILVRENDQITKEFIPLMEEYGIPYITFKQSKIDLSELKSILSTPKVVILTVHSAKGLERPKVAVYGVSLQKEDFASQRLCYVAATRAKKELIWSMPWQWEKKRKKTSYYDAWEGVTEWV